MCENKGWSPRRYLVKKKQDYVFPSDGVFCCFIQSLNGCVGVEFQLTKLFLSHKIKTVFSTF